MLPNQYQMMKPTKEDSRSRVDLHPDLVKAWEYAFDEFTSQYPERSKPIICQTFRSEKVQNDLYKIGRTEGKKGAIVTNAKGGESPHNFYPSLAFDIAFVSGKVLDGNSNNFRVFAEILLNKFRETITWGGNFKSLQDRPHFELKNWKNLD